MGLVALGAHVGRTDQRAQPFERRRQLLRIVGAHDAAAARQRDRLHDAREERESGFGIRDSLVGIWDSGFDRNGTKPRHGEAGVAQALARALLVARSGGCGRWMPRQAERIGDARRDHRRAIADDEDAVEWTIGRRHQNRRD